MIRTLSAVQAEKLVDETFSGGTFDPVHAPAASKIAEALEVAGAANGSWP